MNSLAEDIAKELGVPVRDATGLEGEYDYTLTFTPEKAIGFREDQPAPLRDALPSQLGLKLQSVKDVRVEVVVLDRAKKEPTEN